MSLRELVARGQARCAASGENEQLLDFLFPGPPTPQGNKQAKMMTPLPNDLLPLVLRYWWCGDGYLARRDNQ